MIYKYEVYSHIKNSDEIKTISFEVKKELVNDEDIINKALELNKIENKEIKNVFHSKLIDMIIEPEEIIEQLKFIMIVTKGLINWKKDFQIYKNGVSILKKLYSIDYLQIKNLGIYDLLYNPKNKSEKYTIKRIELDERLIAALNFGLFKAATLLEDISERETLLNMSKCIIRVYDFLKMTRLRY